MPDTETRVRWALTSAENTLAWWHRRATEQKRLTGNSGASARYNYCRELAKVNELRALLDRPFVNADPRITN